MNLSSAQCVEARARASLGTSDDSIYRRASDIIALRAPASTSTVADIGCGAGRLRCYLQHGIRYIGVDAIRHDGFPNDALFLQADLDQDPVPLDDETADITAAIETIEHLDNPRRFMRELTRVTRAGGLIIVSTPNQLSLLSKMTLIFKNEFNAFQEAPGLYPCHRTALLEIDLIRIARECGLEGIEVHYTDRGRIPGTSRHWPTWLGLRGRAYSDNILLSAVRRAA